MTKKPGRHYIPLGFDDNILFTADTKAPPGSISFLFKELLNVGAAGSKGVNTGHDRSFPDLLLRALFLLLFIDSSLS